MNSDALSMRKVKSDFDEKVLACACSRSAMNRATRTIHLGLDRYKEDAGRRRASFIQKKRNDRGRSRKNQELENSSGILSSDANVSGRRCKDAIDPERIGLIDRLNDAIVVH
jgi:hypothetical protein